MKDGTYDITNAQNVKELRAKLSDVTTNPNSARNIKIVRVGLPSQLLADGIRIIDTPGTNSIESWHEEVTKNALKNLSDLSIREFWIRRIKKVQVVVYSPYVQVMAAAYPQKSNMQQALSIDSL